MARVGANRRGDPGTGVSKRAFAATPFTMDVGDPPELGTDDQAALSPTNMSQMVPLNLGQLNGAPADQADDDFFRNLAPELIEANNSEVESIASELVQAVERDIDSYSEQDEIMARGIEEMGFDRSNDRRTDPFPGASAVIHPMLAQAVTDLVSRSMKELLPSGGPAKPKIFGQQTDEKQIKADRGAKYLNWQLTEQCPEYRTEFEKMLTIVCFVGDGTRKLYWDDDHNRPRSEFINSDQFIVPYGISDLETAPRYTHLMYLFPDQVEGYVASGLWRDADLPRPSANQSARSKTREKADKVTNQRPPIDDKDAQYEIMEIHADLHFESLPEDQGDAEEEEKQEAQPAEGLRPAQTQEITVNDAEDAMVTLTGLQGEDEAKDQEATGSGDTGGGQRFKKPFIITIERTSKKVLAIRRNWKQDDTKARKRVWFMHYYLFPWTGWRGIGLWHMIGGLQKSATGALRALLDAAALKSMPGGLRLKGSRTSGNEIRFRPLDYVEVDAPGATDIREVAMPIPFDGPSPVLFELLQFLVTSGTTYASIATKPVAEMNPNAPVGTTLALIEEGGRVYNAIHARLHYSQKKELSLLCELNSEHLEDEVTVQAFGGELVVSRNDYIGNVGIVPVSDPDVSNQITRLARSDTALQLARNAKSDGVPTDLSMAYKQSARAVGIDNVEQMFPEQPKPAPLDPISELMAMAKGQPVDAFPGQNHVAHVAFMRSVAQNPQYQPMIQNIAPQFVALGQAHLVMAIKDAIEKKIGQQIPQAQQGQPLPPQVQAQIANEVAAAAQGLPTEDMFGSDPTGQNGAALANMLGQVAMKEIEAEREKAQIESDSKERIIASQLAADKERWVWELTAKLVVEFAKIDSAENISAATLAHEVVGQSKDMMEKVMRLMHEMSSSDQDRQVKREALRRRPAPRQAAE